LLTLAEHVKMNELNKEVIVQSIGEIFRNLVEFSAPVQIVGTINAYSAKLAQLAGAKAIYLSGAGVANASFGLPDLGMTNLSDVLEDVRRITYQSPLPLLVDIDTGWGHVFSIARTIHSLEKAGVAAIHIEDQINAKRCGHRPNKTIVTQQEMGDRIKACVDARDNSHFVIMARTDAYANEGLNAAIERACYYSDLGADMIFAEALSTLEEYKQFTSQVKIPVLANITEFGKTPLFTYEELKSVGVKMILYPLSAFRAMSEAAFKTYQTILDEGTQKSVVPQMQTREALYQVLDYQKFEDEMDKYKGADSE
jgi:methylisocitrate lyase